MLINSVILILQETVEAALLIGVLLALNIRLQSSVRWFWVGLALGFGGAILLANQMINISEWFDYAGQEVISTTLQAIIYLMGALCVWLVTTIRPEAPDSRKVFAFSTSAALMIFCAVVREGQEIILYLYGFSNTEYLQKTLAGGAMGFAIGVSMGTLLFYSLVDSEGHDRRTICLILLALFAGNMLSQSTVQLMQVDWLIQSPAVWDTSSIITEDSLLGELLYALVGYEATPTPIQSLAYIGGTSFVLCLAVVGTRRSMQLDKPVPQETGK
jgi:high-affinity iron transporter